MRLRRRHARLLLALLVTALLAAPPALAAPFFGFDDDWAWSTVHREAAVSERFHSNTERVAVWWNSTEPHKHRYSWAYLDRVYATMLKMRERPLLDVLSAPHWAIARNCHPIQRCNQTPAHDGDFRAFVRTLTLRYPQAIGIEIGQEPNLTNWSVHPDPRRYAQIMKAGYAGVRQANRHMRVILGSTCCNEASGHGSIGASRFLADLYRYGIKGHYTAIGYHIYPGRAVSLVHADLLTELDGMRAVRNANHDRAPFWITETGYASHGVSPYGGGVLDERNQAQRITITYEVLNSIRDVQAIYIFRLVDPRKQSFWTGGFMGLFHSDFRPKPAANALKRLTAHRR